MKKSVYKYAGLFVAASAAWSGAAMAEVPELRIQSGGFDIRLTAGVGAQGALIDDNQPSSDKSDGEIDLFARLNAEWTSPGGVLIGANIEQSNNDRETETLNTGEIYGFVATDFGRVGDRQAGRSGGCARIPRAASGTWPRCAEIFRAMPDRRHFCRRSIPAMRSRSSICRRRSAACAVAFHGRPRQSRMPTPSTRGRAPSSKTLSNSACNSSSPLTTGSSGSAVDMPLAMPTRSQPAPISIRGASAPRQKRPAALRLCLCRPRRQQPAGSRL